MITTRHINSNTTRHINAVSLIMASDQLSTGDMDSILYHVAKLLETLDCRFEYTIEIIREEGVTL